MSCSTCHHLKMDGRKDYDGYGFCRRFPPQLVAGRTLEGELHIEQHFPWMTPDDHCGEHATALRREEERGYEKGLADGRALAPPTQEGKL